MKKQTSKKLKLGKIRIANLQPVKAGKLVPTYLGCTFIKCPPPENII